MLKWDKPLPDPNNHRFTLAALFLGMAMWILLGDWTGGLAGILIAFAFDLYSDELE